MNVKRLISILLILIFSVTVFFSAPGYAAVSSSQNAFALIQAVQPGHLKQNDKLKGLVRQITEAKTLAEARQLALTPVGEAKSALKKAQMLAPFSDDLRQAETKLDNVRSRILLASSQEQTADAFNGMMLAGLDDDRAANVNVGDSGCNYSTGEIIAIVVGLILGIIPGLILLVVLC